MGLDKIAAIIKSNGYKSDTLSTPEQSALRTDDLINNFGVQAEFDKSKLLNSDIPYSSAMGSRMAPKFGDLSKYSDYMPIARINLSDPSIDEVRAQNQTSGQLWKGMAAQAVAGHLVGGVLEHTGNLLDLPSWYRKVVGTEQEWGNNLITQLGKTIREGVSDYAPIYMTKQAQTGGLQGMADRTWWFSHAPSIVSAASILIPTMAVSKGISLLGKALNIGTKLSKAKALGITTVGNSIMSRHMDSSAESIGAYDEAYTKAKDIFRLTEDEAKRYASRTATSNYRLGWINIWSDLISWNLLLKYPKLANAGLSGQLNKGLMRKALTVEGRQEIAKVGTNTLKAFKPRDLLYHSLNEGFEEANIEFFKKEASRIADKEFGFTPSTNYSDDLLSRYTEHLVDPHTFDSFFWGMAGGLVFGLFGRAGTIKSYKSQNQREQVLLEKLNKQADFLHTEIKNIEGFLGQEAPDTYSADKSRTNVITSTILGGVGNGTIGYDIEFLRNMSKLDAAGLAEYGYTQEQADIAGQLAEEVDQASDLYSKISNRNFGYGEKDAWVAAHLFSNHLQHKYATEALGKEQEKLTNLKADTAKVVGKNLTGLGEIRNNLEYNIKVAEQQIKSLEHELQSSEQLQTMLEGFSNKDTDAYTPISIFQQAHLLAENKTQILNRIEDLNNLIAEYKTELTEHSKVEKESVKAKHLTEADLLMDREIIDLTDKVELDKVTGLIAHIKKDLTAHNEEISKITKDKTYRDAFVERLTKRQEESIRNAERELKREFQAARTVAEVEAIIKEHGPDTKAMGQARIKEIEKADAQREANKKLNETKVEEAGNTAVQEARKETIAPTMEVTESTDPKGIPGKTYVNTDHGHNHKIIDDHIVENKYPSVLPVYETVSAIYDMLAEGDLLRSDRGQALFATLAEHIANIDTGGHIQLNQIIDGLQGAFNSSMAKVKADPVVPAKTTTKDTTSPEATSDDVVETLETLTKEITKITDGNTVKTAEIIETTDTTKASDVMSSMAVDTFFDYVKDKTQPIDSLRNEAKRTWNGIDVITGERIQSLYSNLKMLVHEFSEFQELLSKFTTNESGHVGITNNNLTFIINALKKEGIVNQADIGTKIKDKYSNPIDDIFGKDQTIEEAFTNLKDKSESKTKPKTEKQITPAESNQLESIIGSFHANMLRHIQSLVNSQTGDAKISMDSILRVLYNRKDGSLAKHYKSLFVVFDVLEGIFNTDGDKYKIGQKFNLSRVAYPRTDQGLKDWIKDNKQKLDGLDITADTHATDNGIFINTQTQRIIKEGKITTLTESQEALINTLNNLKEGETVHFVTDPDHQDSRYSDLKARNKNIKTIPIKVQVKRVDGTTDTIGFIQELGTTMEGVRYTNDKGEFSHFIQVLTNNRNGQKRVQTLLDNLDTLKRIHLGEKIDLSKPRFAQLRGALYEMVNFNRQEADYTYNDLAAVKHVIRPLFYNIGVDFIDFYNPTVKSALEQYQRQHNRYKIDFEHNRDIRSRIKNGKLELTGTVNKNSTPEIVSGNSAMNLKTVIKPVSIDGGAPRVILAHRGTASNKGSTLYDVITQQPIPIANPHVLTRASTSYGFFTILEYNGKFYAHRLNASTVGDSLGRGHGKKVAAFVAENMIELLQLNAIKGNTKESQPDVVAKMEVIKEKLRKYVIVDQSKHLKINYYTPQKESTITFITMEPGIGEVLNKISLQGNEIQFSRAKNIKHDKNKDGQSEYNFAETGSWGRRKFEVTDINELAAETSKMLRSVNLRDTALTYEKMGDLENGKVVDNVSGKSYDSYYDFVLDTGGVTTNVQALKNKKGEIVSNFNPTGNIKSVVFINPDTVRGQEAMNQTTKTPKVETKTKTGTETIYHVDPSTITDLDSYIAQLPEMENYKFIVELAKSLDIKVNITRRKKKDANGKIVNAEVLNNEVTIYDDAFTRTTDQQSLTIVHELLHPIIDNKIEALDEGARMVFESKLNHYIRNVEKAVENSNLTEAETKAIETYLSESRNEITETITYALTNKFVAPALAKLEFTTDAKESKSVWQTLKDIIVDLLGLNDKGAIQELISILDTLTVPETTTEVTPEIAPKRKRGRPKKQPDATQATLFDSTEDTGVKKETSKRVKTKPNEQFKPPVEQTETTETTEVEAKKANSILDRFKNRRQAKKEVQVSSNEGINFVFDQNPKLADIGTQLQYEEYINTIFPESQMRDIVHHGTTEFEGDVFRKDKLASLTGDGTTASAGFHFSNKQTAETFGIPSALKTRKPIFTVPVILNMLNKKNMDNMSELRGQYGRADIAAKVRDLINQGFDSIHIKSYQGGPDFIVFNSEQIHILGSQQDMNQFREYLSKQTDTQINTFKDTFYDAEYKPIC